MSYERVLTGPSAAKAGATARATFIRKTYTHLAGAIALFAAIETVLLGPLAHITKPLLMKMLTFAGPYSWLVVLGAFMAVGYIADRWARSATSKGMQYLGLALYVVAESIIFLPLLWIATRFAGSDVLPSAVLLTVFLFIGLTGTVFITKKDFSFLRTILMVGGFVAMGLIVCAILFGFNLGILFSAAMIALAGGYLLYYTSNVLHHYQPGQHVAAALALFAAVALLFYYVLLLFLQMSRD
jgi:hypothetical protein